MNYKFVVREQDGEVHVGDMSEYGSFSYGSIKKENVDEVIEALLKFKGLSPGTIYLIQEIIKEEENR